VEVVVSAEDAVPKPHAAPYALALARLARRRPLSPDAVLALEDGPAGIAAATAAGLRCVVVGPLPAHEAMRAAGSLPTLDGVTAERLALVAGAATEGAR
jgi:beta-phosphoglucomutase-like phosphatase (HAD superfamily)